MLRLNMNTKDIAAVTFLAPTSVDTARYRIRKKMHLDSDATLLSELMKY
jgi:DNA-binding CsgD family transcriptional regulator